MGFSPFEGMKKKDFFYIDVMTSYVFYVYMYWCTFHLSSLAKIILFFPIPFYHYRHHFHANHPLSVVAWFSLVLFIKRKYLTRLNFRTLRFFRFQTLALLKMIFFSTLFVSHCDEFLIAWAFVKRVMLVSKFSHNLFAYFAYEYFWLFTFRTVAISIFSIILFS